jgi:hypothetical protein
VDRILEMPGWVDHRSRRPEVARRTDQVVERHTVPGEVELHTGLGVVRHIALGVGAHRTVLAEVVRRIDPGVAVRHTGPVEVAHHIDPEEARHTDRVAGHHTALEVVELRIGLGEVHHIALVVEVHHTVLAVVARSLAEAGNHLEGDTAVDSAFEAVVDSNLAEEVVRILGVGDLTAFSTCSP